ncbi:trypsin-like serine peptidase [Ruegeria aquimaris]|uniref:Serine protease n=1 Tax=Ruegeria aquimaris TaxID=2984333 RepID=A0ABT3ANW9_9RHOB|nr:serine protease [Ruegeria sp. XHP0148]MCV2890282.1 serine protease [Ruegeria sp. XHP0148]
MHEEWTEERLIASIHGVVRDLRFARPRLRAWYDNWLRARRLPGAPQNFAHAMVVTGQGRGLDPADDGTALCLALVALGGPQPVADCFAGAVAAGLFEAEATETRDQHRRRLAHAMAAALGRDPEHRVLQRAETNPELQAFVPENGFWTDPGDLQPAIILGRRRLCRIDTINAAGKQTNGTGFLVGPSTVLTNFHVVKHVWEVLDQPELISVRFDFSATTGLRDADQPRYPAAKTGWKVAHSGLADWIEDDDYWWDDPAKRLAWLGRVGDTLDYAIIRLDGAPGLQRGWFALDQVEETAPDGVWIMHHPGTEGQTLTGGRAVHTFPMKSRIFHLATTAHGSSGGLVLNQSGTPIGLHYLGDEAGADRSEPFHQHPTMNVAITLKAISDDLRQKNALSQLTSTTDLNLIAGCIGGGQPVFGRQEYFRVLRDLWNGSKRVLRVHVNPFDTPITRPGKSFSFSILQHFFAAPENHYILFRAGDIQVDAYRLACDTLATFAPNAEEILPKALDTTTPAYVRRLVSKFMQQVNARLSDKTVWIVLDDLDKHDLSDASGREFLGTLYDQIGQQQNLRLVLVGLREHVQINGLDPTLVVHSAINAQSLENPSVIFREWLNERGARDTALDEDGLKFLADIAGAYAGTEAPLERLSQFVTDYVAGAANRLFGSIDTETAEDP